MMACDTQHTHTPQECNDENYDFITKVFLKSGIGHHASYLPAWINPILSKEPKYDMNMAMREAEMTMGCAMQEVLEKTGELSSSAHGGCVARHRPWLQRQAWQ